MKLNDGSYYEKKANHYESIKSENGKKSDISLMIKAIQPNLQITVSKLRI
jgi:hypothetical protein